ncbi:MAG TPA: lytic transglycosylase domain-containing protein, partial [Xanthobacteraceae bacterium]|nr:lytic transglycosylase domain-containing protein [Xanthobacteraceae bacterium]
ESGPQLGYGAYANSIVKTSSGNYVVPDAAARRQVMKLRYDPTANAVMAGAFTQHNAARLAGGLGRQPTGGELYMAHVLGPGGAVKLISTAARTPQTTAANLFPGAARANRSIFFDQQGGARSVAQVYNVLNAKMSGTVALSAPRPPAAAAAAAAISAAVVSNQAAPATEGSAAAATGTAVEPVASSYAPDDAPIFEGLFRTDRTAPVSSVVTQLWGAGPSWTQATTSAAAPVASSSAPAPGRVGRPLDLFQFLRPEIRASAHSQGTSRAS